MLGGIYASLEQQFVSGAVSFTDAAAQILASAAHGDRTAQINAGLELAAFVTDTPRSGEGEGAAGPNASAQALPSVFSTALGQGTLGVDELYGVLAGLSIATEPRVSNPTMSQYQTMIGGSATEAGRAIDALLAAAANGQSYTHFLLAGVFNTIAADGGLSFADAVTAVDQHVRAGTVAALDAIAVFARAGVIQGLTASPTSASAVAVAGEVAGLIHDHLADASAAIDALTLAGQSAGTFYDGSGTSATRLLVALAVADSTLAIGAAAKLSTLIDVTSPNFAGPSGARVFADEAVTAVSNAGLSASVTLSMLAALATVPGTQQGQSRDPLHLVGDRAHALVDAGAITGTAAMAAVQATVTALGLPADQALRLFVGIGATGHLSGLTNLPDPDLLAAGAAAVAALVHADLASAHPTLTLDNIAAAMASAGQSTAGFNGTLFAAQLLASAAASVPSDDLAAARFLGRASSGFPDGVSSVIADHSLAGDAAIAFLIGFAGGGDGAAVSAGRFVEQVMDVDATMQASTVVATLTGAITAQTLTASQVVLVLAGLATAPAPHLIGQQAAWSALATLIGADPTARVTVIDAVIGDALSIHADDALALLANVAALGSTATAAAISAEIVQLVTAGRVGTADHAVGVLIATAEQAGQYLYGAAQTTAKAAVAAAVAGELVALVGAGQVTATAVIADLRSALAASPATLDPERALALLVNLRAAGLDATTVESAVLQLVADNVLGIRAALGDLAALQVNGVSTALASAITAATETLLYAPAYLASTAGLGTAAEIAHVAGLIAALFGTDATAAQAIVDGLAARIGATGDVTAAGAATLLVDLLGAGGAAANAANAAITSLTTVQNGQTSAVLPPATVLGILDAAVAAGLGAGTALGVIETLAGADRPAAAQALAALITHGALSFATVDAAVVAGHLDLAAATRAVTSVYMGGGSLQSAALAELGNLAHVDASAAATAIGLLLGAGGAGSTDATVRAAAYTAIETMASYAGAGLAAFTGLFVYVGAVYDTGVRLDARAELVHLVAVGDVSTSDALDALTNELSLSNAAPTLNPTQVLAVLAGLSTVAASHDAVVTKIDQIAAENHARAVNSLPAYGFSAADAIRALAPLGVGSAAAIATTAHDIIGIAADSSVSISTIVAQMGALALADRVTLLAEIAAFHTDPTAANTIGNAIAAQVATAAAPDRLAAFSDVAGLIQDDFDHLRPQKAIELLVGVYLGGQTAVAIAEIQALVAGQVLVAGSVTYAFTAMISSGIVTAADGIGALAALYAAGSAGLRNAAASSLATAITGTNYAGTPIPATDAMAALDAAIVAGTLSPVQGFAFIESILLARLAAGPDTPGSPGEAATAALTNAVNAELTHLIDQGQVTAAQAITALAQAAGIATDAQRIGLGTQIVTLAAAHHVDAAHIVADIAAATEGTGGLTARQAATVLVATAAAGDSALALAAGTTIGTMAHAGSLTGVDVMQTVYGPLTDNHISAALDLALAEGLVAGGAGAAAGPVLHALVTYYVDLPTMTTALVGLVTGGTASVASVVTAAAAMTGTNGNQAEATAILSGLLSAQAGSPAEIAGDLASAIGTGYFTAGVALSVLLAVAAPLDAAADTQLGVGLGEWLAGGAVTEAALGSALALAVNGSSIPPVAAILTVQQALALVLGIAEDASAAAVANGDAAIAVRLAAGLIGTDGQRLATFEALVESAISAGAITATQATALLIDLAGHSGNAIRSAIATELGHFVELGLVGITVANGLALQANAVQAAAVAGTIDPSTAVTLLTLLHVGNTRLDGLESRLTAIAGLANSSPTDTVAQIVAEATANPPLMDPTAAVSLLFSLAETGYVTSRPAFVSAAASGLSTLISGGTASVTTVGARILSLADVAVVAAILDAGALATGTDALAAATVANMPLTVALSGIHYALGHTLATAATALDLVAKFAATASLTDRLTIGAEIRGWIAAGTTTASTAAFRLSLSGLSGAAVAAVAAGAIDSFDPGHSVAFFKSLIQSAFGTPSDAVAAILAAYPADVNVSGHRLNDIQAVAALTVIGGNAGYAAVGDLIRAGRVQESYALGIVEQLMLGSSGGDRISYADRLGAIAANVGSNEPQIVQIVVANADSMATADQTVEVLAAMVADGVYVTSAGAAVGLLALRSHGLSLSAIFADVLAAPSATDADKLWFFTNMAKSGGAAVAAAAAQAGVALFEAAASNTVTGAIFSPTHEARAGFLAGLFAAGDAALKTLAAEQSAVAADATEFNAYLSDGISAAITAGSLTATDALAFLVAEAAQPVTPYAGTLAERRASVDAAIAAIASGPSTPTATVTALVAGATAYAAIAGAPGNGAATLIETGARIAALTAAGLITSTAAATALEAAAASRAVTVALLAGAVGSGLGSGWVAAAGAWIGGELEAGRLAVQATVDLMVADVLAYRSVDAVHATELLVAVGGHNVSGLALVAGRAAGTVGTATTAAIVDAAVVAGTLSGTAARDLLLGAGDTGTDALRLTLAGELDALASRGVIADAVAAVTAAYTAGAIHALPTIAFLAELALVDRALIPGVVTAIHDIVAANGATAAAALSTVLGAAATAEAAGVTARAQTVGDVLAGLVADHTLTLSDTLAGLDAAGGHTLPAAFVAGTLPSLAAGASNATITAVAVEMAALVTAGLAVTTAADTIRGAVAAGTLTADQAVTLAAVTASAGAGTGGAPTATLDQAVTNAVLGLVSDGRVTLATALSDIVSAAGAGLVGGTVAIDLIARIGIGRADAFATVGAAASDLLATTTIDLAGIFARVEALIAADANTKAALGLMLVGLGEAGGGAVRTAVGHEFGALVAAGKLPFAQFLQFVDADHAAGIPVATRMSVLIAAAAGLSPAAEVDLGRALVDGFGLTRSDVATALEAARVAGSLDAAHFLTLLAGVASLAYDDVVPVAVDAALTLLGAGTATPAALLAAFDAAAAASSYQFDDHLRLVVAEVGAGASETTRIALAAVMADRVAHGTTTFATIVADLARAETAGSDIGSVEAYALALAGASPAAGQVAIGGHLGDVLAAVTDPTAQTTARQTALTAFSDALAAHAIDAAGLVTVLAAMASREGASSLAVDTASAELSTLLSGNAITAAQAMDAVDAAVAAGSSARSAVHWLAELGTDAGLRAATAGEIDRLVSSGRITTDAAVTAVGEIVGTTPSGVAASLAIGLAAAAPLLVSMAAQGDAAMQDRVGTALAGFADASTTASLAATIDAALTGATLSGLGALHVATAFLAGATAADAAGLGTWAGSTLVAELTTAGVTATAGAAVIAAAASHASANGITLLADLGVAMHFEAATATAVHDQVAAGHLSGTAAMAFFFEMSAGQGTTGAGFVEAEANLFALVGEGRISGATVYQAAVASSVLTPQQVAAIRHDLAANPDDATLVAITADEVARMTHIGPSTDAWFTRGLPEAALLYERVEAGTATIADAITAVERYALAHSASPDAALSGLQSLLTQAGDTAAAATVAAEITARQVSGAFAWSLANHVTDARVIHAVYAGDPSGSGNSAHFNIVQADPTAITADTALTLIRAGADATHQVAVFQNASGVVSQLHALYSTPGGTAPSLAFARAGADYNGVLGIISDEAIRPGTYPADLVAAARTLITSQIQSGAAAGALVKSLADGHLASTAAFDAEIGRVVGAVASAPSDVASLTTSFKNGIVAGLLDGSIEQTLLSRGIAGVQSVVDYAVANGWTADADTLRQIGLGWLYTHAYAAGNQTLMATLSAATYTTDILTGLGGILSMPVGDGYAISNQTKSYVLASTKSFIQHAVLPASNGVYQGIVSLANTTDEYGSAAGAAALKAANDFTKTGVYDILMRGWDKTQGSHNFIGVLHDKVATDPRSASSYTALAGALAAGSISGQIATELLGVPGIALTAISLGSKAAVWGLSTGAVSDALGHDVASGLSRAFKITGTLSGLIGDTTFNVVQGQVTVVNESVGDVMALASAIKSGNPGDIALGTAQLGMDYFVLLTGYDPRLIGQVGQDFGTFVVDLVTGHPERLKDDVIRLGTHFLDVFTNNIALKAIGNSIAAAAIQINDALSFLDEPFRVLGSDISNGFLKVGSRLGAFGNVIRDVGREIGGGIISLGNDIAHGVSDVAHHIAHGFGFDGYLAGATVFADANHNGVLDPGEAWTTTDATGAYTLQAGLNPIVLVGGTDTATKLPFTGTFTAPVGSNMVSPLTTLVQSVASSGNGDPVAAQAAVVAALGLPPGTDLASYDPIAATKAGDPNAAHAYAVSTALQNVAALLTAAGSAHDPYDAIAAAVASTGGTLDLTSAATASAITSAAGLSGATAAAVGALVNANATVVANILSTSSGGLDALTRITAAAITSQGDTANALHAAGSDANALDAVVQQHTGGALEQSIQLHVADVGSFGSTGSGAGDVHYLTYDGVHYDLQAPGIFEITKATAGPAFEVQGRAESLGGFGYLTAAAVETGGHTVGFDAAHTGVVETDGVAHVLAIGDQFRFADAVLQRVSSETTRMVTASFDVVTVVDHGDYLDVSVTPGAGRAAGSFVGLLGNHNGLTADDLTIPGTGTIDAGDHAKIETTFADAWRVSASGSLLASVDQASIYDREHWFQSHDDAHGPTTAATGALAHWQLT